jgi:stage III sporulation protein AE
MRKIWIALLALLLLAATAVPVYAADGDEEQLEQEWRVQMQESIEEQLQTLDLSEMENALLELDQSSKDSLGSYSVRQMIVDIANGEMPFSAGDLLSMLGKLFLGKAAGSWVLLLKAVVLALLCSLLTHMRSSFGGQGASEAGYFVCYMLIMVILVQTLVSSIAIGTEAIGTMVSMMQGALPVLLLLLTALGGAVSASVFQPAAVFLTGTIATIFKNAVLPVVLTSGVFTIVSNISEQIQTKRLSSLLRSGCKWLVGAVLTVYVAVIALQGLGAASIDGISIRTMKYTIDRFVPIAGGMISDTMDTFLASSLIVKNATGIAFLVICMATLAAPVVQILANVFLFRVAAAVLEPVSDKRLVDCMYELSDVLVLLLVIVLAMAVMMMSTIGMMMAAGNANVMLR